VEIEQEVCPYGLVAKTNVWYLVYGCKGTARVIRVASIVDALMLPQVFVRPDEFNLENYWGNYCSEYELDRTSFLVKLRVSPEIQTDLHLIFGTEALETAAQAAARDALGWITIDIRFESFGVARTRLLGLGQAVEVLEPETMRKSLLDYAKQVIAVYQ
jgi:predicted DNA-binding transcriptional regulator YafY